MRACVRDCMRASGCASVIVCVQVGACMHNCMRTDVYKCVTEVCESNVFTGICLSVGGWGVSVQRVFV